MALPRTTQSICPICKKPIAAEYKETHGAIYLEMVCPAHGNFSALSAENKADWETWMSTPSVCVPPKQPITKGMSSFVSGIAWDGSDLSEAETAREAVASVAAPASECPLHCGVCENHLMTACCVLLDVTERCNQHCPYCFAVADESPDADPPLHTIEHWYDRLIDLGEERPFNIQLSGGEPTVREDLPEIIQMGRSKGFDYIQLNTNGKRLGLEAGYAETLKAAGLTTVFLQFDGMNDDIYRALRAQPLLEIKLKAIENCARAGLPVTLVPTVVAGVNTEDIGNILDFMLKNLHVVKGIHFQPVSYFGRYPKTAQPPSLVSAIVSAPLPLVSAIASDPPPGSRVTMFSVMHALEVQSGGRISYGDLVPISTGHPLCCFSSMFIREPDGSITALVTEKQRDEGMDCCCGDANVLEPIDIIRKDRDFVLNKWVLDETARDGSSPSVSAIVSESKTHEPSPFVSDPSPPLSPSLDLDDAVSYIRRNSFTLSGMAFMDEATLDAERLKRCRVQVFSKDERLIPFCAYNSIYRSAFVDSQ
jgi:uncharacterized radical SAM superfamily Fe-S cluster-containing enzyme